MSASAVRPAVTVTALTVVAAALLAGCGSVTTAGGGAAGPSASAGPCGVPLERPLEGWVRDEVRIVSVNDVCAEFEVTNAGNEAADFSVLFGWTGADQRLDTSPTGTVTAVPPGATVRGRIEVGAPKRPDGSRPPIVPSVKISRVRSVPTAEAPSKGGPCPASGVRLYADEGDAAMGLRVVGLHLVNCGTSPVTVDGYPQVQALDEKHKAVDSLQVVKGGAAIATGTGADTPPRRIVLKTGEGARSAVVWRNTNDNIASDPVNAPYLRVRATPDAAPVLVTPELDLGTTGRLGVGAWTREDVPQS
ncbi:hypothetical protein TR51_03680 [Kitasatospora griseola]|uniref:DUF4232 domain-containing protein n=1 Tax=Kitasatospora griseola TaxID=2064 RepID=A0A0D0NEF9_KITGR|nr:DUF4232 domain-containing protein [Kitasatospora griseola]KIQ66635.1 hypothetical protein TR51_03680 [Kitasatospora griseola]